MNAIMTMLNHIAEYQVPIIVFMFTIMVWWLKSLPKYDAPNKGKTRYQWIFFFTDNFGVIVTPPNDDHRRP